MNHGGVDFNEPRWLYPLGTTVVHAEVQEMRDWPALTVRLSPDLKAAIEKEAERNHRSQNGEIAALLEKALACIRVTSTAAEASRP